MVHSQHLLALDGLRGVAALAVVVFHRRWFAPSGHLFDHAYLAVDFFFLLSGLVIDHAYRQQLQRRLSFGKYALKRVVRLYPLIIAGAVLGLPFVLLRSPHWHGLAAFPFAVAALPAPSSLVKIPFEINRPSWSLFFEMVASIVYGAYAFRLSAKRLAVIAGVAGCGLLTAIHLHGSIDVGAGYGDVGWGFFRVAFPFTIGVLLNRARLKYPTKGLPFVVVAALLLLSFAPNPLGSYEAAYVAVVTMIVYPSLIYASCGQQPTGLTATIAKAGAFISFPIYAIHYPVFSWVERLIHPQTGWPAIGLFVAVAIITAVVAGFADERARGWIGRQLHARSAGGLPNRSSGGR